MDMALHDLARKQRVTAVMWSSFRSSQSDATIHGGLVEHTYTYEKQTFAEPLFWEDVRSNVQKPRMTSLR